MWSLSLLDNPASESPEEIIRQILTGMERLPVVLPDRQEAVRYALSIAEKGILSSFSRQRT